MIRPKILKARFALQDQKRYWPNRNAAATITSHKFWDRQTNDVIDDVQASEQQLYVIPRWVLDKLIQSEIANYDNKYKEFDIRCIPKNANVISTVDFFPVQFERKYGKLKLKCRLAQRENGDGEKDSFRTDSSAAQFLVIRVVLYAIAILNMRFAEIDVTHAYF